MRKVKRIFTLLFALMMTLSLCACGSAKQGSNSQMNTASGEGSYYNSYAMVAAEEEMADYDTGLGFAAPSPAPVPAAATSGKAAASGETSENPDKIIYSSDVTVETTKFDDTISKISDLVERYGGWIESSSVSGSNYYQKVRGSATARDASYTLRIPSTSFQTLMDSLSELGNIPYSHIYTENVTSQYYDAQAHLKAYQTQETRLLEMMEIAETVEDVIVIEDRLTELRYQIESLQSMLNNWDRRVSYSTVYLNVKEVREYTPEEKLNPTYGQELAQALKEGLHNAGQLLKELLVFLVELLPVLIILVPVIWLVVWLLRKVIWGIRARRTARKTTGKNRKKAQTEPENITLEQSEENNR